jgi:hypothetical protein
MPNPIEMGHIYYDQDEKSGGGLPTDTIEIDQNQEEIEASVEEVNEFQLTPELEASIMDKVQDIFDDNTAFSVAAKAKMKMRQGLIPSEQQKQYLEQQNIKNERQLRSILENGLLGGSGLRMADDRHLRSGDLKQDWVSNTRNFRNSTVYFNVLGRMHKREHAPYRKSNKLMENPIELSEYFFGKGKVIAFLLDLSKFKEVEPHASRKFVSEKTKTYHIDRVQNIDEKTSDEEGFALHFRVAPQFLKGMIVSRLKVYDDLSEQAQSLEIDWIADIQKEIYKSNPELLMPIYDSGGNLLWPKQMAYEELKGFIEERDRLESEQSVDSRLEEPQS